LGHEGVKKTMGVRGKRVHWAAIGQRTRRHCLAIGASRMKIEHDQALVVL